MAVVKIHNEYECGSASNSTTHVRNPLPGETSADWWQDVVFPLTGDDHKCDAATENGYHEATIVMIDDPELRPGDTMTWEG